MFKEIMLLACLLAICYAQTADYNAEAGVETEHQGVDDLQGAESGGFGYGGGYGRGWGGGGYGRGWGGYGGGRGWGGYGGYGRGWGGGYGGGRGWGGYGGYGRGGYWG